MSDSSKAPELAAWKEFCHRIEALGERILTDEFPNQPEDGPEAIAHLADQVSCWLGWSIGHSDTTAPFFHRSNDLVTQWGGPNQDNSYHHARIDPHRRYRVHGRMNSCEDFALTLRVGFMHMEDWGTQAAISGSDRGIGPGDEFEIFFGGDGSEPNWVQIPEEVTTLSLREYYIDWQPVEPAVITIECLDDIPAPPRIQGAEVVEKLDHALHQIERSTVFWNEYMVEHRAEGTDNQFNMPMKLAKGFAQARYSFCFFELAPDEALYIESDVPDARYWGLQLATNAWFEQVDPIHRISSINQKQVHKDADGRVRIVLSHDDPGTANWLDTGGHHDGLLTFRWFWPKGDPTPSSRLVKLGEVADLMPADSLKIDAAARAADIRARKQHLIWRFRT